MLTSLCSCASFPKDPASPKSNTGDLATQLNGTYLINPIETESVSPSFRYDNLYSRVNRKHKTRDTLVMRELDGSHFELELKDEKELIVKFYKNDELFETYQLKARLKDDGYLYVRNKNVKFWGIPFALGYWTTQRMRLSMDANDRLLVEYAEATVGAILVIVYPNWESWNSRFVYGRKN